MKKLMLEVQKILKRVQQIENNRVNKKQLEKIYMHWKLN